MVKEQLQTIYEELNHVIFNCKDNDLIRKEIEELTDKIADIIEML